MENIAIEKFRIFFKDLIVLGRETLYCFEKNITIPLVYEIFEKSNRDLWYNFFYDNKIKKWVFLSYDNTQLVIFNPTYKDGINNFLERFNLEDINIAHTKIEKIYEQYQHLKTN